MKKDKMILVKEIYNSKNNSYEKTYNSDGFILTEINSFCHFNSTKHYTYNENALLLLEEIIKYEDGSENKFHTTYEFDRSINSKSYRATTILKERRDINDINSDSNIIQAREIWHNVDEITNIVERKFDSENFLVLEKNVNLNENSSTFKYYSGNLLLRELFIEKGIETKIENIYLKSTLLEKNTYINDVLNTTHKYVYNESLIESELTFKYYNNTKYLAFEKKYYYNVDKNITKTEIYGRYSKEMVLIGVHEIEYYENKKTQRGNNNIDYFTYGFFDDNELKKCYEAINDAVFEKSNIDLTIINEFSFEEEYNSSGQIIKKTIYNPINETEILQKYYYYYENVNSTFKIELCFSHINEEPLEKKFSKYLYYENK